MKKNAYIIREKETKKLIFQCYSKKFAKKEFEKLDKDKYEFLNIPPVLKAWFVSYQTATGEQDYRICIDEKDYLDLVRGLASYLTAILDIWVDSEKDELPKTIPDEVSVVMYPGENNNNTPLYVAFTEKEAESAVKFWKQQGTNLKVSSDKLKIYRK